ncbi:MAG: PDZ domain-containing protein, partial [Bauldia litoralis]
LLPPILDDLIATGHVGGTPRPWLGIYAAETQEKIVVVGVVENGPAFNGGLRPGDVVLDIAGAPVGGLPDFFRTIWEVGPAGATVPLNVWREGELKQLRIESSDRNAMMRFPRMH